MFRPVPFIVRHLIALAALLIATCASAQTVAFSHQGGFCDEAFDLQLSSDDASLKIYYTLDGTIPTAGIATEYTAPIHVSTTTPVSAVCVGPDGVEYRYAVRTYIFLRDVYRQPASPQGYPSEWTKGYKADYAMDQTITLGPAYSGLMDDAMQSIPTVCITTSIPNLFAKDKGPTEAPTGGIYIYPEEKGIGQEWERPASIEYYDADGMVQENCGLRIHGGNSRKPGNTAKHSFRVSFRKQYGAGKLKYKIFDDDCAVHKFDHLVLRAGYNYSWLKNGSTSLYPQNIIQRTNAQYVIDAWTKEAAHAMGHRTTHRRFVHLFLNGLYWGLYEISEKMGDKFMVQYEGGVEQDWDVVEDHKGVIDGDRTAFDRMFTFATGATKDNTQWRQLQDQTLLDIEQFCDYMLLQWYIGNEDWDENNWRAVRHREAPEHGFQFLVWDAEMGFTGLDVNKVTLRKGEPTQMIAALKQNPLFRQIMQQRIQRHFFAGGILTPERAAALYQQLCQEIDLAIIGESARWGDYRKMTGETDVTYTRNDYWLKRKADLLANYFPKRSDVVLKQLQSAGLFDPSLVSGIASVTTSTDDASAVYNAMGQKVDRVVPGMYIVNGRKVIVKF